MRRTSTGSSLGRLVARMMAGSWRQTPDRLTISDDEVAQIAPLLLASGTAALAWRRIESSDLTRLPFPDLKDAYRAHLIDAAVHDINTYDTFQRVNAARIKAVLFKGWALSRLYPDAGLRPYGDIDLWVSAAELDKLYGALSCGKDYVYCVDSHVSFFPQYERSFEDVLNRSQLLHLNGVPVRIPADEDHLRFICLHFLYHGGWRPLWLCDVALMVEAASSNFDWDRCLRGNRKHSDWIACVIGLAHQLLDADISRTPVQPRAQALPRWLPEAVLRQWGKGPGMSFAENLSFSLPRRLLKPVALFQAFREHYRNPIQASVEMNARFSDFPRSFYQIGSVFLRIPEFASFFGSEIRRT